MKLKRTMVVDSIEQMCDIMCGQPEEYGYCLRCGRRLKTEEAKIRGYGNICFEKIKSTRVGKKPLF